jgi:hypothetical protein
LPLPGAGVTFFAAAKKVTKESSFFLARSSDSVVTPQKDIGTQLESALNHPPRPLNTHVLRAPWLVKTISNDDSATYSSLGKPVMSREVCRKFGGRKMPKEGVAVV